MSRSLNQGLNGLRIAVYARYSSINQREASIDDQVRRCEQFVRERGGAVDPERIFADRAVSGASLQRVGFEKLLGLARTKQVDVIVTEDASRISREFADAATLFRELQYLEVTLLGVADGIDTSAKHAKLTFGVKSLVNDLYLEDLRDKTKRGLEGRALSGLSTGGLPYGYRSQKVEEGGRLVGFEILIDEEQASVVRRVFQAYTDGQSYDSIARSLTNAQVPPPRAKSKHRLKGWVAGTVRAFLKNEAYVGLWTFGKKEWRKLPGTNVRRYRHRRSEEVLRRTFPERAIVSQELWDAVQERLGAVARKYGKGQEKQGASSLSPRTSYPLSGVLTCGECGSPMVVSGGSSAAYYKCSAAKKRGTCENRRSQREDVARAKILGAVREVLTSPKNIVALREIVVERLRALSQGQDRDLKEAQTRLSSTETKISRLIEALSEGIRSPYVTQSLRDLEAQAASDKATIERLKSVPNEALVLPHPAQLVDRALNLQELFKHDPVAGREALRRLLGGRPIVLRPDPAGHYVAEATLFPLLSLDREGSGKVRGPASGCAGRI